MARNIEPTAADVAFLERFARGTRDLQAFSVGACCACETCGQFEADDMAAIAIAEEPSFSWSPCDTCNCRLGGDRHPAHYIDDSGAIRHLRVCTDCLLFAANGTLPSEGG